MKVCVYGAGGVGGYFGARLAEAGMDVTLVARGAHAQSIKVNGLRLSSINGDALIHNVKVVEKPESGAGFQLAIVAVKAWQVEEAANALCGSLAEDGIALPLQNGVDAPDQLADALGNDRAIAGLCGLVSYIEAPGHIAHVSVDPFIQLGERDGSVSSRCQQLAATLADAKGVEASVPQNMQAALWQKFMFIVALSGAGAVTRAPLGITRSHAETKALLEACVNEAYQVGCASGVQFPHTAVDEVLSLIDKSPAHATVSMQRDICEGKPSELFSQNGAVVRMGQALGVATPVNSMITAALTPQEHRARDIVDFDRT